jgi:hypothetical protein
MRILIVAIIAAAVALAGSYHFAKPAAPKAGSVVMLPMPPHKPKNQDRVGMVTLCAHAIMGC